MDIPDTVMIRRINFNMKKVYVIEILRVDCTEPRSTTNNPSDHWHRSGFYKQICKGSFVAAGLLFL
jgi:hypothetical protein